VSDAHPPKPKLYFDGGCPVCAREIALYQRQTGADSIDWVDVSQCSANELGKDLPKHTALSQLHFRTADGQLIGGAAAFVRMWQTLPRWRWFGRLFDSNLGLRLLNGAYQIFLRARSLWRPSDKV
jgi:predicted DCC family thiol-disulfide oxidoreductase YuxK